MKRLSIFLIVVLSAQLVWAQSAEEKARIAAAAKAKPRKVQKYWVDGDTKLIWAAKDNGSNIDWNHADAYCRGMTLGGMTGWRLASIDELARMFDASLQDERYKIRGPITLSGCCVWSGIKNGSSKAWNFDFFSGQRESGTLDDDYGKRA